MYPTFVTNVQNLCLKGKVCFIYLYRPDDNIANKQTSLIGTNKRELLYRKTTF